MIRTTPGAAARTPGRASTRGSGGSFGTAGPTIVGSGSMRARRLRKLRGGTIELSSRMTTER